MTTFKIGDRVRHIHANSTPREIVAVGSNTVCVRGARVWDPSLEIWITDKIALEEAAEPRKRLREYTDLADGDVVVIAGVDWTYKRTEADGGMISSGGCTYGYCIGPLAALLVDEVRRKPRTKKRRVYEEVDVADAKAGDFLIDEQSGFHIHYTGGKCPGVVTFYRLVEETEVPR